MNLFGRALLNKKNSNLRTTNLYNNNMRIVKAIEILLFVVINSVINLIIFYSILDVQRLYFYPF